MGGITLGAADEQIGQYEEAGDNSYRSSFAKALAGLAADPMALCHTNEPYRIAWPYDYLCAVEVEQCSSSRQRLADQDVYQDGHR